jgi:xylulokinase
VSLLGIDIGTSEIKAAVITEDGTEIACVSSEYECDRPEPGFAELDTESLWGSICDTVRHLGTVAATADIHAAAFSVHGESFVAMDRNGRAVAPAILNIDSRAAAEMDEFVAAFGAATLYEKTGLPPHPMYTLPKIAWLRKQRPATADRASQFLCLHDYLLFRITGSALIDRSLASRTMGFNVVDGAWDESLLAAAGVSRSQMAPVATGGVPVGYALEEVAGDLGLPQSVLWVTGGHDQACCSVGSGGLIAGTAVDVTGTFECISTATDGPLISAAKAKANIPCERHTVPNKFLSLTYTPGGVVLKWCRDQLARDLLAADRRGSDVYKMMLSAIPTEPTGLFFLPYFFGTGTPWLNPNARAVVFGLQFSTSRDSVVKAAIEGVSYEMLWNLETLQRLGVPVNRVVAVGGGAKSREWLQLKADIFGREVVGLEGEAACRGAAICAGVGCNVFSSFDDGVESLVPSGHSYEPQKIRLNRYKELFEQYKELAHQLYGFALPEWTRPSHV